MRLMAMCSSDSIEVLVNVLRNRLDLSVQVVLDIEHVALVVFRDEIDRQTKVTEAARTTNPVQIGVRLAREVEIDNNVDGDDVDAASKHIRRHQAACLATLKVMENAKVYQTEKPLVSLTQFHQLESVRQIYKKLTGYGRASPFVSG